jgi:predicted AAA+ superfamily ATPase
MYIKREIETRLKPFLPREEIIAVLGPRRAGKTTVLRKMYEEWEGKKEFLTFEDFSLLELFENNPKEFIEKYVVGKSLLCIDEFQYAKNGGKTLKYIYDTHKIKILISGSSAIDLTVQALGKLTGRVLIFELYPFSFDEFLQLKAPELAKLLRRAREDRAFILENVDHNRFRELYVEFASFGGYPQVVLAKTEFEKRTLLQSIYSTYFFREVRDMIDIVDDRKLANLIRVIAIQNGGLINYSELCKMSGVSFETLKRYLVFLEKTYIIKIVLPFHKNRQLELIKTPKFYFLDTGLLNAILDDFRSMERREDKGPLLENVVFTEFIKQGKAVQFWRTKEKQELDFVVNDGNRKFRAFEVKFKDQVLTPAFYAFQNSYRNIPVQMFYFQSEKAQTSHLAMPAYLL